MHLRKFSAVELRFAAKVICSNRKDANVLKEVMRSYLM